jgi:hypothetical protein
MHDGTKYYRNSHVIRRMLEYCGVSAESTAEFELGKGHKDLRRSKALRKLTEAMTTEYLVGWGARLMQERGRAFESVYNDGFGWLLHMGLDLFRSIWDGKSLLGVLDVEYVSKRYAGHVYLDQVGTFWKLEPFYRCLMVLFRRYGIDPLVIATGQGYHFSFRVDEGTPAYDELVAMGHVDPPLQGKYDHPVEKMQRPVPRKVGLGYDGMGKIMEFLTHHLIRDARDYNAQLPVTVGDVVVGNERMESLSMDLSGYANPIFMRDIRLPFSTHHKHKVYRDQVGFDIAARTPIQVAVPRYTPCNQNELTLDELFQNRRDFHHASNYARAITTEIPEVSAGMGKLLEDYRSSDLAQFHRDFDSVEHDEPEDWWKTYDRFELEKVPPCVAHPLSHPNPLLLQPTVLQLLVRVLTGKQWWHPKHVAGLIRSKYERDYGWQVNFFKYDACTWANVWTRFYAGLLATGLDARVDQNCISHQQKGLAWDGIHYCVRPHCGYSLGEYR